MGGEKGGPTLKFFLGRILAGAGVLLQAVKGKGEIVDLAVGLAQPRRFGGPL